MYYPIYNALTTLATPLGAGWLTLSRKHRNLLARFAPHVPQFDCRPLWIHACSVGEVGATKPIIAAVKRRWPERPILLTASTAAGFALANASCPDVKTAWCPFDHLLSVRMFVRRLRPLALLLVETELWPNMLRETCRFGAPTIVINGRLSDKHYDRCLRFRSFYREILEFVSAAGMQNREYAERLAGLGMSPERIHVTGATKFDGAKTAVPEEELLRLRGESGLDPGAPLLIFGSTRPGDEALAVQCWESLRSEFPSLKLVVAVRHSDRLDEAMAPFKEPILRRSEVKQGRKPGGERVFFLDTVGELISFYAMATVAVVGGSFYPGVNGHNPLEPAALGVATVFGPFMRNFIDPARVLVESGGARQVASPDGLLDTLRTLLSDADARHAMARNARDAVLSNQGAIERNLDLVESLLPRESN